MDEFKVPVYYAIPAVLLDADIVRAVLSITPPVCVIVENLKDLGSARQLGMDVIQSNKPIEMAIEIHKTMRRPSVVVIEGTEAQAVFENGEKEKIC